MKKADVTKYLLSKTFYKNVGIAFVISILLVLIIFISLRIYTHHGESFSVPDLRGLSLAEVEEITESYDLRFQISDSVYLQNFEPGTVVEQLPKANFKVKENRMIFLTIKATSAEMVRMPDVTERSLREAAANLVANGLVKGKLIYKPDIARNYVLEQQYNGEEIKPGESIPKGSVIDLVLGEGIGDKQSDVPNLIGIDYETAENITTNAFLNLGVPIFDNSVLTRQDSLNAKIYKQKPAPKLSAKIPLGDFIDVWLTIDSARIEDALLQTNESYYDVRVQ